MKCKFKTNEFVKLGEQYIKWIQPYVQKSSNLLVALCAVLWTCNSLNSFASGTFYVDGANPACSDSGPGTESMPYCTILAAADEEGGPGTTILVKAGVYREKVSVPASGATNNPFIIKAIDSSVVVDGADDFSFSSDWTLFSGNVWLAADVTWSPKQVYVDGARLTLSSDLPGSLPLNTFRYISGQGVYVNIGGDNPGVHETFVGSRANGFRLSGDSWVTIDGFTVTRTEDSGIYAKNHSDNISIINNIVNFCNDKGIAVKQSANVLISGNVTHENNDHGISLTGGVSNSVVENNESFLNFRPGIRAANGLHVHRSPGNLSQNNLFHNNQDSGQQINGLESINNISIQNTSWNNGDHGFDHVGSSGTLHVGDVAWGNYKDGFSVEGSAINTQIFNSIAVENGLTTGRYNLWVDSNSTPGFVSDFNIFWNSTTEPPIKYTSTEYTTIVDYTLASGHDVNSIQSDPLFVDPMNGDFHLLAGSPAIDSADSSVPNWPNTDGEGNLRQDDPSTANTGAGLIDYADRGCLEAIPTGTPVATLSVTPSSGVVPLIITADASASFDPNGSLNSYLFDFGDGTALVGPQSSPIATHTYTTSGNFIASITVTDNDSLINISTAPVQANLPPTAVLSLTPLSGMEPLLVVADASSSFDPNGTVVSYLFDFGDGTIVGPQSSPTATHTYPAGDFSVIVTVTDDNRAIDTDSEFVQVTPDNAENLVGNPSFEVDTSGWSAYRGAPIQRVTGGVDGLYSLEITGSATTTSKFGINDSPNWVQATPAVGTRYRFSAWVRSDTSSGSAIIKVREYNNGVKLGSTNQSPSVVLTSSWQLVTVDHVSQGVGSTLDFQTVDDPVTPGEVFQVDNISIKIIP